MLSLAKVISLIRTYAPVAPPEVIAQAVTDYLENHPEIEVADGSITEEKLASDVLLTLSTLESDVSDVKNAIDGLSSHFATYVSANIFNKNGTIETNKAVKKSDGSIQNNNGTSIQYIPFPGAGTYSMLFPYDYYGTSNPTIWLYDTSKNPVRAVVGSGNPGSATPAPMNVTISSSDAEGVAFFGYCYTSSQINNAMFVEANTYPEEYIPYQNDGYKFDGTVDADNVLGFGDKVLDTMASTQNVTLTIAGGIRYSDGVLVPQSTASGYTRTDYITYLGESFKLINIRCGNTYGAVGYYDKNKKYISGIKAIGADTIISSVNVPNGTVYVVFASNNGGYVIRDFSISGLANKQSKTMDDIRTLTHIGTRMKFGAHNGSEYYAPECSIPAYRIAGQQGWEWAWIAGIWFSADNTMYVMHDETVDRTTDGTGTISELTDDYINSLHIDLTGEGYNLSDFTQAELVVPTFEQILQQCIRYGMKMCIRVTAFPYNYSTETAIAKWDALKNLLVAYNVPNSDVSFYVSHKNQASVIRTLFGADAEISTFQGSSKTAQNGVDWFDDASLTGNRAFIINISQVDLTAVKLLHNNNIKVYAYGDATVTLDTVKNLALWGVDIYQNATIYKFLD